MENETKIIAEPGKQEVIIIREFDAPRDLVFRAYTESDLYKQWIGPRNLTTDIEKFDVKKGGSYRYISTDEEGNNYAFNGVIHEVRPNESIIETFEYEGLPEPGHVALEMLKLEDLPGGRTKIIGKSVFQSEQDRDGMIESGMESGVKEGFERLDELLEKMQKQAA